MVKLQNNFTTPEQSKRLLELGVPADSADCYLLRTHTQGDTFIVEVLHDELYSKKDKFTNLLEYLPCWSVGRMIEIIGICAGIKYIYFETLEFTQAEWLEKLIKIINDFVKYDKIDFSKLDE